MLSPSISTPAHCTAAAHLPLEPCRRHVTPRNDSLNDLLNYLLRSGQRPQQGGAVSNAVRPSKPIKISYLLTDYKHYQIMSWMACENMIYKYRYGNISLHKNDISSPNSWCYNYKINKDYPSFISKNSFCYSVTGYIK